MHVCISFLTFSHTFDSLGFDNGAECVALFIRSEDLSPCVLRVRGVHGGHPQPVTDLLSCVWNVPFSYWVGKDVYGDILNRLSLDFKHLKDWMKTTVYTNHS